MKYRKKPVIIEAILYIGAESHKLYDFCGNNVEYNSDKEKFFIKTLEGDHLISEGDYIIKGVKGEFYPCKPDIFESTYEKV